MKKHDFKDLFLFRKTNHPSTIQPPSVDNSKPLLRQGFDVLASERTERRVKMEEISIFRWSNYRTFSGTNAVWGLWRGRSLTVPCQACKVDEALSSGQFPLGNRELTSPCVVSCCCGGVRLQEVSVMLPLKHRPVLRAVLCRRRHWHCDCNPTDPTRSYLVNLKNGEEIHRFLFYFIRFVGSRAAAEPWPCSSIWCQVFARRCKWLVADADPPQRNLPMRSLTLSLSMRAPLGSF